MNKSLVHVIAYIMNLASILGQNIDPYKLVKHQRDAAARLEADDGPGLVVAYIEEVTKRQEAKENLSTGELVKWGDVLGIDTWVLMNYMAHGILPEGEKSKVPR